MKLLLFLLPLCVLAAPSQGSLWRDGNGPPANSLGTNGDYYLDDLTGNVHTKRNGVYVIVSNIKGRTGDTGATGAPGGMVPDPVGHAGEFLYSDGTKMVYSKNASPNPTVSISLEVEVGKSATFTVSAWGPTPYTFQWSKNGTNIPGATSAALVFPSASLADAGTYICAVTNTFGTTTSRPCVLAVK